jgi:hypothetical protein
MRNFYQKV